MQYRQLGRAGLSVSAIGLGTEYLLDRSPEVMRAVVRRAAEAGVNYIDLLYNGPRFWDDFGPVLAPYRERFVLGMHWGCGQAGDQMVNVYDQADCRSYFEDTLKRLGTDHADIALVMMVDGMDQWGNWAQESIANLRALQEQGRVGAIGMSSHRPDVARRAVESGQIDVLMYPVNLATAAVEGNVALGQICAECGVGMVAMKPYAGGQFFLPHSALYLHWVQAGGETIEVRLDHVASPVPYLSYVLDQPAIATTVPGVKSVEELDAALAYLLADEKEREYTRLLKEVVHRPIGVCVYCNHCLPCPAGIDIGQTMRLFDQAQPAMTPELQAAYDALPARASDCTACRSCVFRCPFEVDIVGAMERIAERFGS